MSEWIRHRGSKSMPKCLEGKKFEVRYRNGGTRQNSCVLCWEHDNHAFDVMAYRILGDINPPDHSKGFPVGTTAKDIGAKVGDKFIVVDDGHWFFKKGWIVTLCLDDGSTVPRFRAKPDELSHSCDWKRLAPIPPKTAIELQAEEVGIPDPAQEWPEDRINAIGQNGNDGLHYDADSTKHVTPAAVNVMVDLGIEEPTTAPDFLQSALNTLTQRGKDYDKPEGERSAAAVAVAFNAITGRNLTEAEVWLVLQLVKDVRQWQNPDRYHADSALDCVAYAALKAEALAACGK